MSLREPAHRILGGRDHQAGDLLDAGLPQERGDMVG
jgi:hypothetical protein